MIKFFDSELHPLFEQLLLSGDSIRGQSSFSQSIPIPDEYNDADLYYKIIALNGIIPSESEVFSLIIAF